MSNRYGIDINKVCRTCLVPGKDDMKSIFESSPKSTKISLAEILMSLAPLKCDESDGLSTLICASCIGKLTRFHAFQMKCLHSDSLARKYLETIAKKPQPTTFEQIYVKDKLPIHPEKTTDSDFCANIVVVETPRGRDNNQKSPPPGDPILRDYLITPPDNKKFEQVLIKRESPTHQMDYDCNETAALKTIHTANNEIPKSQVVYENLQKSLTTTEIEREMRQQFEWIKHEIKTEIDTNETQLISRAQEQPVTQSRNKLRNQPVTQSRNKLRNRPVTQLGNHSIEQACNNAVTQSCIEDMRSSSDTDTDSINILSISSMNQSIKKYEMGVAEDCFDVNRGLGGVKQKGVRGANGYRYKACASCEKVFYNKTHLTIHRHKKHATATVYACNYCKLAFADIEPLCVHLNKHKGEYPYFCTICNATYNRRVNMTAHLAKHTGANPPSCTDCNVAFGTKRTLHEHMQTHVTVRPYSCDNCYAWFTSDTGLREHKRKHAGDKPYLCNVCDTTFALRHSLDAHVQKHGERKAYACKVCKWTFAAQDSLRAHAQTHARLKPYACTECTCAYRAHARLKNHMRTHTRGKGIA